MPGNGHVRFGRRAAETDRQKRRHRAAARPHNLVADPAFLMEAWARVRGNKGARSAGVDGQTAYEASAPPNGQRSGDGPALSRPGWSR